MKANTFNVETINFKDKDGNAQTIYKVWFSLTTGVGWLMTNHFVKPGQEVDLEVVPMSTQDVKTNMRLALRIV